MINFCRITIFAIFIVIGHAVTAQVDQTWRYYYPDLKEDGESKLYLRLENNNFVKNNEYFGNYIEGYTMMGYTIHPSLVYYASPNFRIKAGLFAIQYSGMNNFKDLLPTFSFHAKLSEKLDFIIGGLRGDVHHKLIEPIFNPENQYTRPIENGFQFLYNSKNMWFDAWVDWEQFIFLGDDKPEKFTAGISSEITFTNPDAFWRISIPAQMIATHLGGQISDYPDAMQTIINLATGVKLNHAMGDGFIRNIGLSAYFVSYHDITAQAGWDFTVGSALYPVAELEYKYGSLMAGYWKAHDYISTKGSPLFQSSSNYKEGYYSEYRDLVTTKLSFTRTFIKQLKIGAMAEVYYDIPAKQLDYSYGINLVFTPNFFITKLKFD